QDWFKPHRCRPYISAAASWDCTVWIATRLAGSCCVVLPPAVNGKARPAQYLPRHHFRAGTLVRSADVIGASHTFRRYKPQFGGFEVRQPVGRGKAAVA